MHRTNLHGLLSAVVATKMKPTVTAALSQSYLQAPITNPFSPVSPLRLLGGGTLELVGAGLAVALVVIACSCSRDRAHGV